MKTVRFGIIGMGNMGPGHAYNICHAPSSDYSLTAVCDIVEEKAKKVAGERGVPYFTDAQKMYDSGLIDAVIIAVPHYWHPPLAIRAARKGIHVLTEKPAGVTVGTARAMVDECKKQKVVLAAMFQQRTRGVMMKAKQMIEAGEVGEVFRISMVCSDWYRTQSYYDSGSWRGTWDGEGGGILLNQAPHSLDLFQWIGGMPKRVTAVVGTRIHKIEVENTANAICEYDGGKIGYIYATTAEAPGMEQFMFCGDKGTIVIEGGKLKFGRLAEPISRHLLSCPEGFKRPDYAWEDVTWTNEPGGDHLNIIKAMAAHILRGEPLVATGAEALNELSLSNAIYISGYKHKTVELPLEGDEIDRLIVKLEKERSTGKGGGLRAKAAKEMKKLLG